MKRLSAQDDANTATTNANITSGSVTGITDITVADGGTGRSTSTTAYGLLAAGTTATSAHQTLSAGATTDILVGGGASALPVWTAASGSGSPVRATSPALTTPTIASFTNATHDHTNAAGGGILGAGYARLTGEIIAYGGRSSVTGWLWCDGAAQSRSTYSALFDVLCASLGTFTVTIATPAVVTLSGHVFVTGDAVYLTTTGALPTGLSQNTLYYVVYINTTTFNLATTRANAVAGTKIATSGTQSGVHTLRACPYGLGDGSTTFNVPDLRGRVALGNDGIGATTNNPAGRINLGQTGGLYGQLGATGGEQGHQLIIAELAAHTHNYASDRNGIVWNGGAGTGTDSTVGTTKVSASTGGDAAHNNMPPAQTVNYMIKH